MSSPTCKSQPVVRLSPTTRHLMPVTDIAISVGLFQHETIYNWNWWSTGLAVFLPSQGPLRWWQHGASVCQLLFCLHFSLRWAQSASLFQLAFPFGPERQALHPLGLCWHCREEERARVFLVVFGWGKAIIAWKLYVLFGCTVIPFYRRGNWGIEKLSKWSRSSCWVNDGSRSDLGLGSLIPSPSSWPLRIVTFWEQRGPSLLLWNVRCANIREEIRMLTIAAAFLIT